MDQQHKITTHFTKGLIIGLVMVVIGIVFQILNIYEQWVQYVITALYAISIIGSCYLFSKEMDGNVRFGQIFSHGFKTVAIVILISIASFIITSLIMPDVKQKALDMAREQMEKDPRMTESTIKTAIEWTDKFYFVVGIVGSLFGLGLSGAIASLIGAAISKKTAAHQMPKSL
jgi:hypothetical protein